MLTPSLRHSPHSWYFSKLEISQNQLFTWLLSFKPTFPRVHPPSPPCGKHQLQIPTLDTRWRPYAGPDLGPCPFLLPGAGPERSWDCPKREAEVCGSCGPRLALGTIGKKEGPASPPRGSSRFRVVKWKSWDQIGRPKSGSFSGLSVLSVTRVGWHLRACQAGTGHGGSAWCMQIRSCSLPQEARNLYSYVKSQSNSHKSDSWGTLCRLKKHIHRSDLAFGFETPGVCECRWEQEGRSLGEWEAGSFLAEVGLKGSEHGSGWRRSSKVCSVWVGSGNIRERDEARAGGPWHEEFRFS